MLGLEGDPNHISDIPFLKRSLSRIPLRWYLSLTSIPGGSFPDNAGFGKLCPGASLNLYFQYKDPSVWLPWKCIPFCLNTSSLVQFHIPAAGPTGWQDSSLLLGPLQFTSEFKTNFTCVKRILVLLLFL